jgi:hypothetical protein
MFSNKHINLMSYQRAESEQIRHSFESGHRIRLFPHNSTVIFNNVFISSLNLKMSSGFLFSAILSPIGSHTNQSVLLSTVSWDICLISKNSSSLWSFDLHQFKKCLLCSLTIPKVIPLYSHRLETLIVSLELVISLQPIMHLGAMKWSKVSFFRLWKSVTLCHLIFQLIIPIRICLYLLIQVLSIILQFQSHVVFHQCHLW